MNCPDVGPHAAVGHKLLVAAVTLKYFHFVVKRGDVGLPVGFLDQYFKTVFAVLH